MFFLTKLKSHVTAVLKLRIELQPNRRKLYLLVCSEFAIDRRTGISIFIACPIDCVWNYFDEQKNFFCVTLGATSRHKMVAKKGVMVGRRLKYQLHFAYY